MDMSGILVKKEVGNDKLVWYRREIGWGCGVICSGVVEVWDRTILGMKGGGTMAELVGYLGNCWGCGGVGK